MKCQRVFLKSLAGKSKNYCRVSLWQSGHEDFMVTSVKGIKVDKDLNY